VVVDEPSLFEKIGGNEKLNILVDKLFKAILEEEELCPFFAEKAKEPAELEILKSKYVNYLSYLMGG
jgi:truncated hemoglobin YjbI